MAKPIKDTPVLKGKDAENFLKQVLIAESKKIDPVRVAKMRENFRKIQAMKKF